jgi:hypothetical protein
MAMTAPCLAGCFVIAARGLNDASAVTIGPEISVRARVLYHVDRILSKMIPATAHGTQASPPIYSAEHTLIKNPKLADFKQLWRIVSL